MNRKEKKKINPAKCFFKTTRMGVPYKYCLTNDMDYAKYNRLTLKRNQDKLIKAEKQLDNQEDIVKDLKEEIRRNKSKLAEDKRRKQEPEKLDSMIDEAEELNDLVGLFNDELKDLDKDKKTTKKLGSEILTKIKSKLKSKSITEIKTMDIKEARKQRKAIRQEIKAMRKLKPELPAEKDKVKAEIKKLEKKSKELNKYLIDSDSD